MNLTKLFQKKTGEDKEPSGRVQRAESSRRAAPAQRSGKPKKVESAKRVPKKTEESPLAWWHRFRQYLREVAYELRKVVWPSRKEAIGSTSVVLVIVILSGAFLGIVDLILSRLVRLIIG